MHQGLPLSLAFALVACHSAPHDSGGELGRNGQGPPSVSGAASASAAPPNATSTSPAADALAGFVRYAPTDGGFSVLMPAEPKTATTNVPARDGALVVHTAMVDDPTWAFSVSYYELGDAKIDAKALFDDSRSAVLKGLQGTLDEERDMEVAGHPARDCVATIPGAKEFMRTILVGRRVYSLVMVGRAADAPRARAFFGSFQLVGGTPTR